MSRTHLAFGGQGEDEIDCFDEANPRIARQERHNMKSTRDTIEEPGTPETDTGSERHMRIQTRAYELYLARGEQPGAELDDWVQAELEIDNEVIS